VPRSVGSLPARQTVAVDERDRNAPGETPPTGTVVTSVDLQVRVRRAGGWAFSTRPPSALPYHEAMGESASDYEGQTDAWVLRGAIGLSAAGLGLLVLSELVLGSIQWLSACAAQLGGLLIVTGLISFTWEKWVKRSFTKELLDIVGLANRVRNAGLVFVGRPYEDSEYWNQVISAASQMDLAFVAARTWRRTYWDALSKIAANPRAEVRITLPDYTDLDGIRLLARRFSTTTDALVQDIKEAESDFRRLFGQSDRFHLQLSRGEFLYTYMRFDATIFMFFYAVPYAELTRSPIIGFTQGEGSKYLEAQFDALFSQANITSSEKE